MVRHSLHRFNFFGQHRLDLRLTRCELLLKHSCHAVLCLSDSRLNYLFGLMKYTFSSFLHELNAHIVPHHFHLLAQVLMRDKLGV